MFSLSLLLLRGLQLPFGSNQSTDPEQGFKCGGGPACKSSAGGCGYRWKRRDSPGMVSDQRSRPRALALMTGAVFLSFIYEHAFLPVCFMPVGFRRTCSPKVQDRITGVYTPPPPAPPLNHKTSTSHQNLRMVPFTHVFVFATASFLSKRVRTHSSPEDSAASSICTVGGAL